MDLKSGLCPSGWPQTSPIHSRGPTWVSTKCQAQSSVRAAVKWQAHWCELGRASNPGLAPGCVT